LRICGLLSVSACALIATMIAGVPKFVSVTQDAKEERIGADTAVPALRASAHPSQKALRLIGKAARVQLEKTAWKNEQRWQVKRWLVKEHATNRRATVVGGLEGDVVPTRIRAPNERHVPSPSVEVS